MTSMKGAAGDPIPSNCELIEVRVGAVPNLFNAMDPSPFREKDLDPNAEEFIVSWARIDLLSRLRTAGQAAQIDTYNDLVDQLNRESEP